MSVYIQGFTGTPTYGDACLDDHPTDRNSPPEGERQAHQMSMCDGFDGVMRHAKKLTNFIAGHLRLDQD